MCSPFQGKVAHKKPRTKAPQTHRVVGRSSNHRTALPQELLATQPNYSDGGWGTGIFARLSRSRKYEITKKYDSMPYLVSHTHANAAQLFDDAVMGDGLADHGRELRVQC